MRRARRVEPGAWRDYFRKGRVLLEAAEVCLEFGLPDAAAVLSIHAGILHADAVLVRVAGSRSASEKHEEVLELLAAHLSNVAAPRRHLAALLAEKNQIEYTGERIEVDEVFSFNEAAAGACGSPSWPGRRRTGLRG